MRASSSSPFARVVIGYGVVALLWILWSDALVEMVFENIELLAAAQAWKGMLFVLVTTGLLFWFLKHVHAQMQRIAENEVEALRREAHTAALLQSLLDSSPDAIFAKDRQGRYILVNREVQRLVGHGAKPMIGSRAQDLLPLEQADRIWDDERKIMRNGRVQDFEYEVDTHDGRRTFHATKGPLRDESGTIGVFGTARDITDMVNLRHQLQESEERYRVLQAVSSRVTDAVVSIGPDQRLVYANDKAARLVGRQSPQDLLGHIFWDELPASRGTTFETAYRRARESGEALTVADWYESRGVWLEFRLYPAGEEVSVCITDITARKQAERE